MPPPPTRPVWFLVFEDVQSLDVSGPFEVFAGANAVLGVAAYQPAVVSLDGGAVVCESGLTLLAAPIPAVVPRQTTLVLPGGSGARRIAGGSPVVAAAAQIGRVAERVLSVCTGTFVAAAAGLAAGRRVTTHWAHAPRLQERYPGLVVEADRIFVRDGNLWSSAGVTAGIDLALAVVEHDHGAEVAQTIARHLVMFLRRPGGQSQFATPVWSERATTAPIRAAQHDIDADPSGDHRLDLLAGRAGMSTRHFARCFTAETGIAPGAYVAKVRVEAARRALEATDATVDSIAAACGFGSAETMRRAFHRHLGVAPDDYRGRFRLPAELADRRA